MAIPDFQSMMSPILGVIEKNDSCSMGELKKEMEKEFTLTPEELEELLPSGKQRIFDNRVLWALNHLGMAGLMRRTTGGKCEITDEGRDFLNKHKGPISVKDLMKLPKYRKAKKGDKTGIVKKPRKKTPQTPEENIEDAYIELRQSLTSRLLEQIMESTPAFFEQLVVDLLVGMGYGGSFKDAARTVGRAADGGIDGVIKQDILGLDSIYIQAKRWKGNIGRPAIQAFVGSLEGRHASKGVFITTSNFTEEAKEYAESIAKKVILIDGEAVCQHMIDFNIGVRVERSYELPAIDLDYFESKQ
jgi:restriction system protein